MSAEAVIRTALAEVGYLEKASPQSLDSKTANAGRNNYTKYGAWYGMNGEPWCDMFVSWCAAKAGEGEAVGKFAYVPSHRNFFSRKGRYYPRGSVTPRRGDVIIFREEEHIGFVDDCRDGYVYTIEGNTSGGSGLVANGGGVFRKRYSLGSSYIMGYGCPDYQEPGTDHTEKEEFEMAKIYQNGSTPEKVYADTAMKLNIGSLNPWEKCDCLGRAGNLYIVRYQVDGTDDFKVGLTVYDGGLG